MEMIEAVDQEIGRFGIAPHLRKRQIIFKNVKRSLPHERNENGLSVLSLVETDWTALHPAPAWHPDPDPPHLELITPGPEPSKLIPGINSHRQGQPSTLISHADHIEGQPHQIEGRAQQYEASYWYVPSVSRFVAFLLWPPLC